MRISQLKVENSLTENKKNEKVEGLKIELMPRRVE